MGNPCRLPKRPRSRQPDRRPLVSSRFVYAGACSPSRLRRWDGVLGGELVPTYLHLSVLPELLKTQPAAAKAVSPHWPVLARGESITSVALSGSPPAAAG